MENRRRRPALCCDSAERRTTWNIKMMKISMEAIKTPEELEFVVFCIENVATALHVDGATAYRILTDKSDVLKSYIAPCYNVLHTQGKEYIVEDVLDVLKNMGVALTGYPQYERKKLRAHPVLLQMKYARVIGLFAEKNRLSLDDALDFFYRSELYPLVSEGVSDLHCMSDDYLAEELTDEHLEKGRQG